MMNLDSMEERCILLHCIAMAFPFCFSGYITTLVLASIGVEFAEAKHPEQDINGPLRTNTQCAKDAMICLAID